MKIEKIKKYIQNYFKRKELQTKCDFCLGNVTLSKNLRYFRCTKSKCRRKIPTTRQPLFFNSKMDFIKLSSILNMILFGAKSKFINEMYGTTIKTIRRLRKELAVLLKENFENNNFKIGGPGVIVELDESKFGRRKYNRGKAVEGIWIFGMVEKTQERKIIMLPIHDRSAETLQRLITKYIHPESIIYSDMWGGYRSLSNLNWDHQMVNHKLHFRDPVTGVHTNTIEGNWSGLKEKIPKRYRRPSFVEMGLYLFILERNLGLDPLEYLIKLL
jgi:transposase-like protein